MPNRNRASRCATVFLALLAGLPWLTGCYSPEIGGTPQATEDEYRSATARWRVEPWIEGLEIPWSMVFLPDGRALVSERPGRIRLIEDGRLSATPYASVEAFNVLSGGLMGLALHPRFPAAPYVYAMVTYRDGLRTGNRIIRLRHAGNRGHIDRIVYDGLAGGPFHNGGRIAFGPDGMLYVTIGDTLRGWRAQHLEHLVGKVLRLTPEGGIPADNAFPGSPVYTYGHRNPQGIAWHPRRAAAFVSEHGPSYEPGFGAYDEINVLHAGGNYGWPKAVGAPGLPEYRDPVVAWTDHPVPPSGITFHGEDLYVATLGSQALIRIVLAYDDTGWRATRIIRYFNSGPTTSGELGRLRDVVSGPDGALYLLTNNTDPKGTPRPGDDHVYRLTRRSGAPQT